MFQDILIKNSLIEELIADADYANAAKRLLEDQKKTWKQLGDGYESLKNVRTKNFQFDGFRMKIQFNPGRYISTAAKVDEKSINERKCFLCPANLPEEQKGILCEDEYLILGNPYPIFPEHFTIPNIRHIPQQIKNNFPFMLKLVKDLSKYYVIVYNGPKCGASAPDHFHFQAGTKNFMPIVDDFHQLKNEYGELLFENDEITVSAIDDGLRRVIVFLREKHRSSHYFAEGENKILLSAASVDLGGVCITPLEKDFERMTKEKLTEILAEVSLNKSTFSFIKQKVGIAFKAT